MGYTWDHERMVIGWNGIYGSKEEGKSEMECGASGSRLCGSAEGGEGADQAVCGSGGGDA